MSELQAISASIKTGLIVDNRFQLICLLGSGGMSTVYRATQIEMERTCAVKFLHAQQAVTAAAQERFRREAKAVSTLSHPNIVKVLGYGFFERQPYIAMEYLEGESLAALLKRKTRLPKEDALPILLQICDALEQVHKSGIVHRDIKSSNIMLLGSERTVKLVDFGLAKFLPESGQQLQRLTQTADVLGTCLYMSPEQCLGQPVDARSDLYSLGCLMYEVLTGELPALGNSPFAVMYKQMESVPERTTYLDDASGDVVLACLEKDPQNRPQSASKLKEEILAARLGPRLGPRRRSASKIEPGKLLLPSCLVMLCLFVLFSCPYAQRLSAVPGLADDLKGRCLAVFGRYKEALDSYDRAIDKGPFDENYFLDRAAVYAAVPEMEKSEADKKIAALLRQMNVAQPDAQSLNACNELWLASQFLSPQLKLIYARKYCELASSLSVPEVNAKTLQEQRAQANGELMTCLEQNGLWTELFQAATGQLKFLADYPVGGTRDDYIEQCHEEHFQAQLNLRGYQAALPYIQKLNAMEKVRGKYWLNKLDNGLLFFNENQLLRCLIEAGQGGAAVCEARTFGDDLDKYLPAAVDLRTGATQTCLESGRSFASGQGPLGAQVAIEYFTTAIRLAPSAVRPFQQRVLAFDQLGLKKNAAQDRRMVEKLVRKGN